jgi:hypothetical protein
MKKIRIFIFLAITALAATALSAQQRLVRLTRYEGERITGVSASSGFDVYLVQSRQTKVVAEISEAYESFLDLSLEADGTVRVGLRSDGMFRYRNNRNTVLKLTVCLPELSLLKGSGGADIHGSGTFTASQTTIDVSGGADLESLDVRADLLRLTCTGGADATISGRAEQLEAKVTGGADADLNVACGTAEIEATGGADLTLRGTAEQARLDVAGGADLDARDFAVKNLTVEASSAGDATVWAVDELKIKASSASSVRYRGNPATFSTEANSAASVRKSD